MTRRPVHVTDTDIALLRSVARDGSVVAASRRLRITRDQATYRLARLGTAFGGPMVTSGRGGRGHGQSRLTPLGDRLVRGRFDAVELLESQPVAPPSTPNRLYGVYHRAPAPAVTLGTGLELRVAFPAEDGEPVSVALDPESILVARARFATSARNVWPATIERVRLGEDPQGRTLVVRTGRVRLRVAVTEQPVREMRLAPGARVWLYVKATAVRRVGPAHGAPIPGSPRR